MYITSTQHKRLLYVCYHRIYLATIYTTKYFFQDITVVIEMSLEESILRKRHIKENFMNNNFYLLSPKMCIPCLINESTQL